MNTLQRLHLAMVRITYVPEELWRRLALLDPRCDTFLRRDDSIPASPLARPHRQWHVRIELRRRGDVQTFGYGLDRLVDGVAPSLPEALKRAISIAEARGWNTTADHQEPTPIDYTRGVS